jgi:parallel beta helix pectate lyase-like protein
MATVESPSETTTPIGTSTTGAVLPTEEPTLLDSVQALSSDTSVVVLDENGQPLPLAAQGAAEAVVNGDPMWCPNGVAPGGAGCTSNFISMSELLTLAGSYINSQNVNGTIWITSGSIPEPGTVTIDGATYTNWANQSLTLQGGWSGVPGDTTIGPNSVFTVPIQILNWNANVNINNITVQGASGSGLGVTTNGRRVVINNSRFINNQSAGSGLFPWGDGADISPNGGNVIITNSEFSGNNWDGLYIVNSGDISISDSNLNSNGINNGYGAGLDAYGVNTIDIKNGEFNGNQSYDILANCNTGTFLSVNFLDLLRLDISVDQNCQVAAGLAVTPTPTLPPGITPTPTVLSSGATPTPTSTQPPVIEPTQTLVPGTTSTPVPTPRGLPPIRGVVSSSGNASRSKNTGEIFLECKLRPSFPYTLPNGDKVEIICPSDFWSGKAAISRLDNTSLPGELPSGYIYASAFQVDISQVKEPIQVIGGVIQRQPVEVIPGPGYIRASFVAPSIQVFGGTYSILYWDNGSWILLKDFMLAENGGPQVFDLHPGSQEDPRKIIISGVEQVDNSRDPRVEVSTNFPGIFVLAQH